MPAELTVARDTVPSPDRLRAYRLMVDGVAVAKVKRGETATVTLSPGRHRIRMKIDWCGSRTLELDVSDSDRLAVRCRPGLTGLKALAVPLYLTFLRNRYIELEAA